jgi:hypothetical protein
MKKLAILFLLTTVLAAFSFALEGVGDFEAGLTIEGVDLNASKSDGGKWLALTPTITFSRDIIENLNLFVGLNTSDGILDEEYTIAIPLYDGGDTVIQFQRIDIVGTYGLALGPGRLSFALLIREGLVVAPENWAKDSFKNEERLDVIYALKAGPGTLSAGVFTGFSIQPNRKNKADGKDQTFLYDQLGFTLGYATDMGVFIETETGLHLPEHSGDSFKYDGTWLQIGYADKVFGGGVEAGIKPTWKGAKEDELDKITLPIKPYFEYYGLYKGLTVGAFIKLNALNTGKDIYISPGIYATYKF